MPELDPDLRALQDVRDAVQRAYAAVERIAHYDQAETDRLCRAMAEAGARAAYDLAKLTVEETGIGRVHYKILKNLFGSEGVWESIQHEKTVGILSRDERRGIVEVGTPSGVIAAIIPTTNPTSTALGKALISVKGKNAIVMSPHPRARRSIGETAEVLRRAIERAGGPSDLVQSLPNPTVESTGALMKHKQVALILATGGTGLVRAAYSSGKPAYGVGPGNVPVYVDRSAKLAEAARGIVASQSFDNATFCCSEQALVLDRPIADAMLAALRARGAYLCNEEETKKLEVLCNKDGIMNPDVVGKDPCAVAALAGFRVPRSTSLLLAPQGGVGREHPLSIEVLCPLLSVHVVDGWKEGCRVSLEVLHHGGLGHTLGVWAEDEAVLHAWFLEKPASRIIVNGPTSEGAVGYSTHLVRSLSLGCGPQAGNITSDNITARHLINVKRVAWPRSDWREIYERDMARAAAFTGDVAPRGSGLAGDPALSGGPAHAAPAPIPAARAPAPASHAIEGASVARSASAEPTSNWRGNPASSPPRIAPVAPVASRRAPAFLDAPARPSRPDARAVRTAVPSAVAPARESGASASRAVLHATDAAASLRSASLPQEHGSARGASPYVGSALSAPEIREMMAHAGAGCPLGPCRGCPHHDVRTGACTA